MSAESTAVSVDAIDAALAAATPSLGEDEQWLAAAVLRLSSAGEPAAVPAAAGALAWGGLGLALAALLVGALTVIRLHRRPRAGGNANGKPAEAKLAVPEIPPR